MKHVDKKVVIIGGGVAGVSAAEFALKNGFQDVTIIENSKSLGGLHRDIEINGLHYDLGAFFFWPSNNLMLLFPEILPVLVKAESEKHLSLTKQFNLDTYPLSLKLYIKENGITTTTFDIIRLFFYRLFHSADKCKNVDELLTYYMGFFYKKTGLKNYIRRLYNLNPENINVEFAARRLGDIIERLKFKTMFKSFLKFNWANLNRFKIAENAWARPESGFKTIYEQIEQKLRKDRCSILLGENVSKIHTCEKRIETQSGKIVEYDYLLSSMPLAVTGLMTGIPFSGVLNYKALCSLFYEIPGVPINDCFVLYNFSERGKWKRITFHSNYYNRTHPDKNSTRHYFVVESMPDDTQIDNTELAELLNQDFKSSFSGTKWQEAFTKANLAGHHITRNAYPILDTNFEREQVLVFKEKMKKLDIYMVGRQGEFEYINSSDASLSAVNAVKNIIEQ